MHDLPEMQMVVALVNKQSLAYALTELHVMFLTFELDGLFQEIKQALSKGPETLKMRAATLFTL